MQVKAIIACKLKVIPILCLQNKSNSYSSKEKINEKSTNRHESGRVTRFL